MTLLSLCVKVQVTRFWANTYKILKQIIYVPVSFFPGTSSTETPVVWDTLEVQKLLGIFCRDPRSKKQLYMNTSVHIQQDMLSNSANWKTSCTKPHNKYHPSSSPLCNHSVMWLGKGPNMLFPHVPLLHCPLPDGPIHYSFTGSSPLHCLVGLPLDNFPS